MVNPIGITLPIRLGTHGYFNSTDDPKEQIRSNLINLLLTHKGERPFQPTFGCNLPRIFFEANTDNNIAEVHAIIETAVSEWMPFIRVDDVQFTALDIDSHSVRVYIQYTILTSNTTDSIQVVV